MTINGVQSVIAGMERAALGVNQLANTMSAAMSVAAAWAGAEGFRAVIGAAMETNVVLAQLRRELIQHGDTTQESIKALSAQADSLEHLTGVSKDTSLAVDRMLISSGATAEQAMRLTPLILDLSAAMGMDATSAARRLSGAFQGQAVEFGKLHLHAGNVNDLIGQLTHRFEGEAEAAFKARGALGTLSVATEESKRALGGLMMEASNNFFSGIATGIEAATTRMNAFKDNFPQVYGAMTKAALAAGKAIGDNIGKILLLGAALTALALVIKSVMTLTGLLATAFTSLGLSAGTASAAISLLGAALAGWLAGDIIGQITVMGMTINDRVTVCILEATKAWLKFKYAIGETSAAQLRRDLAGIQKTIDDLITPPKPIAPKAAAASVAGGPAGESYSMVDLEKARQMMEMQREGIALSKAKVELIGDQALKEKSLPVLFKQEIALLNQERALVLDAQNVKGILTEQEAEKMLLEIDKALLSVKKEDYELAMRRSELFFESLNREMEAVRDNIALRRDLYQASPLHTEIEKRKELLQSYAEEKRSIQEAIALLKNKLATSLTEPERKATTTELASKQHDLNSVNEQTAKIQGQGDPASWGQQWTAMLTRIRGQFTTFAQETAKTFEEAFNNAFQSINSNISKVIMGTEAWKVALYQIGQSILQQVITAIMQMAEKWIISQILMATMGKAIAAAASAALAPIAAAQSAIWATPATLSTIASFGGAATAAPGEMAAAVAESLGSFGTYATGGFTGAGGRYEPAGIVHRGEFVMDAESVSRIGLPRLQAMQGGSGARAGTSSANMHFHLWDDGSRMNSFIQNNPSVQHSIVKLMAGNRTKIVPRQA